MGGLISSTPRVIPKATVPNARVEPKPCQTQASTAAKGNQGELRNAEGCDGRRGGNPSECISDRNAHAGRPYEGAKSPKMSTMLVTPSYQARAPPPCPQSRRSNRASFRSGSERPREQFCLRVDTREFKRFQPTQRQQRAQWAAETEGDRAASESHGFRMNSIDFN